MSCEGEAAQSLFIRSKYRLASYQVYLSRDPLIVSGEIWAEQSCHIPDHCNRVTIQPTSPNTINLFTELHWAADLYLLPPGLSGDRAVEGKVEWFIKCVSQSVGDSLYWVYFVLRGGGIFTMRSVLFSLEAARQWLTHNNIVPDCQPDAPRLSLGIWSQAATYLSSSIQRLVRTADFMEFIRLLRATFIHVKIF